MMTDSTIISSTRRGVTAKISFFLRVTIVMPVFLTSVEMNSAILKVLESIFAVIFSSIEFLVYSSRSLSE